MTELNPRKALFSILFLLLLLPAMYLLYQILVPVSSDQLALRVMAGDNAATIATKLRQKGVIRSQPLFQILAKLRGTDRRLIAGTYTLGGRSNLLQTLQLLEQGHTSAVRVTFPEGLSLSQTLRRIDRAGLASYSRLDSLAREPALVFDLTGIQALSLEGFLYPETYYFDVSLTPREILQSMTSQFEAKLRAAGIDHRGIPNFYSALILASIVERESGGENERPIVAGVLRNRLEREMNLESCSTVDYILESRGIERSVLTFADTKLPSPYNTYINGGLPPGPICNPSVSSIRAALHPARTDFLFFVADRAGGNDFSVTAEEHFAKIRKYRGADWQ